MSWARKRRPISESSSFVGFRSKLARKARTSASSRWTARRGPFALQSGSRLTGSFSHIGCWRPTSLEAGHSVSLSQTMYSGYPVAPRSASRSESDSRSPRCPPPAPGSAPPVRRSKLSPTRSMSCIRATRDLGNRPATGKRSRAKEWRGRISCGLGQIQSSIRRSSPSKSCQPDPDSSSPESHSAIWTSTLSRGRAVARRGSR